MLRLDLFRAMAPSRAYPDSPLNVTLNDSCYDLILPSAVADVVLRLLSSEGPFRRLDKYCSSMGIDTLRSKSSILRTDPYPSYAEGEMRLTVTDRDLPMGYCLQQAVANRTAAEETLRFAIENSLDDEAIDKEVTQWIMGHSRFFIESGGFEVARALCYFSADERDAVLLYLDGAVTTRERTTLRERSSRSCLLRDLLKLTETSHTKRQVEQQWQLQ